MADRIDISATVRAIDQASGPLRSIADQIRNVGDVAKTAGASLAKMATQPFGSVSQNLRGVGSAVGNLLGNFKALASPLGAFIGVAGIGGAIAAMKDYIATAREISKVSIATGASPEMVQQWRYMVGDVELADSSLRMLQRNLANFATKGGKQAERIAGPLSKMGISLDDVRKGAIGLDEILPKLAAGFEKNTNPTSRAAVAQALFGRSGLQMIPFLEKGPAAFAAAAEALERYGHITEDNIKTADAARIAFKEFGQATNGLKDAIVVGLLPSITPLVNGMRDWIVEMKPAIVAAMTEAVKALGRVVGFLWQGIQWIVDKMGGWENAAIALGAVFAAKLIPDIINVGKELVKLGGSLVFNPVTAGAVLLAGAAAFVYRNWKTIGPWLEEQFQSLPPAAQQAFTAIARWGEQAYNDIIKGWKTGGLVGAVTAAAVSAGRAIYQNWDAIVEWMQGTFPEITAAAQEAWAGITQWANESWAAIVRGWNEAGLLGAMAATWDAIQSGASQVATWVRDQFQNIDWTAVGRFAEAAFTAAWQANLKIAEWTVNALRSIDWGGIASSAGSVFLAAWQGALNLVEWLRGLDWENAGYVAGQAVANALSAAMDALAKIDEWAARQDWGAIAVAVYRGLDAMVTGFVEIGARFMAGLINGMIDAIPGLRSVVDGITSFFDRVLPDFVKRAIGWGGARETAAAAAIAAIPDGSNVVPFRAPTSPAAPLAPGAGPTVAQPNVLQGMKEIPVRLAGEIAQRLKIDMSPDLRAMLQENKTRIDQLGVQIRSGVDVGVTMGPAMGEAA